MEAHPWRQVAIGVELNSRELACVVFDQDLEACGDIKVADRSVRASAETIDWLSMK